MPVYAELTTVELIDLLIREEDRVTLEHIQELAARNRISDPARPGPDGPGHLPDGGERCRRLDSLQPLPRIGRRARGRSAFLDFAGTSIAPGKSGKSNKRPTHQTRLRAKIISFLNSPTGSVALAALNDLA